MSDYCGKKVTDHKLDENEDPFKWTFYHSFYLSFIICSTIGYGNISPSIPAGKIFLIFYALIGMPVHGFVFAQMGNYFATKVFIIVSVKSIILCEIYYLQFIF